MMDYLAYFCIILGSFLGLIGGLGMHRMPDFYSRLHAVGITDTLCTLLILLGLALQAGLSFVSIKLLLIFLFLYFTSPASSYSLANNAWKWGLRPQGTDPEPEVKGEDK